MKKEESIGLFASQFLKSLRDGNISLTSTNNFVSSDARYIITMEPTCPNPVRVGKNSGRIEISPKIAEYSDVMIRYLVNWACVQKHNLEENEEFDSRTLTLIDNEAFKILTMDAKEFDKNQISAFLKDFTEALVKVETFGSNEFNTDRIVKMTKLITGKKA